MRGSPVFREALGDAATVQLFSGMKGQGLEEARQSLRALLIGARLHAGRTLKDIDRPSFDIMSELTEQTPGVSGQGDAVGTIGRM